MRKSGITAVTLTLALLPALLTGCGTSRARVPGAAGNTGPEKTALVVAAVPAESASGLYIAQAQGLFTRQGLHVTIENIASPALAMPDLLRGDVDIISGQWTTFFAAQSHGAGRFRALASGLALGPGVEAIVVPPGSPIQTVRQLKGATIAVNTIKGIDQMFSDAMLTAYGLTPADVHYVAIPFPRMGAALAAGQVNAGYLTEPYLTQSEEKYGDQVIGDPDAGVETNLPIAGYTATAQWVQRYPRTAAAFARAINQANQIASTDPGLWRKIMASALGLPAVVAGIMASGTYPATLDPRQLQRLAALMRTYSLLDKPFNVTAMLRGARPPGPDIFGTH